MVATDSPAMEELDLAVDSLLVLEPLTLSRVVPPAWDPAVLAPATPRAPLLLLDMRECNRLSLVEFLEADPTSDPLKDQRSLSTQWILNDSSCKVERIVTHNSF